MIFLKKKKKTNDDIILPYFSNYLCKFTSRALSTSFYDSTEYSLH